jgi:triacylglycerol lipase
MTSSRAAVLILSLGVGALGFGCSAEAESDSESSEDGVRASAPIFRAPETPKAAKSPFVLVHAFNGSASNSWSFNGVKEALERDGNFAYAADIPTYAGTPERAEALLAEIDEARRRFCEATAGTGVDACVATTKVNIIAHSQGGLDARYAISKLGYGKHVASLTTMGTPHRGTPLGDIGLGLIDDIRLGPIDKRIVEPLAEALFTFIAEHRTSTELAQQTHVRDAFFWLSERRAEDSAYDMPDDPSVYYQSWAGIATILGKEDADEQRAACDGKVFGAAGVTARFKLPSDAMFLPLVPAFSGAQKPNDGHIPVASAKWGEFRGCLPTDHLDLIGRPAQQNESTLTRTGFDHIAFYRVLADELAGRGY